MNMDAATLERAERERMAGEKAKLGHRRIDEQGEVSYKKVPTDALMRAIQLGIADSIGKLASCPKRDLLLQDFEVIDTVAFPTMGTTTTPTHNFGDFRFKTYAPIAFRYFRELFHIRTEDFLSSICTKPLKELSNAGASGSIFYVSSDDQFIIKTVQHKEAEFLQKLLPGYYMNINQNPRTLLPKFFGLFCYQTLGKNIRLLVMNNLLPQTITMHEKYDLKGSTYKRAASKAELAKGSPTLKDLDFNRKHPNGGIVLEGSAYDTLIQTLQKDCLVLEAFKIMDYSLLVGIHNVDEEATDRRESTDGIEPDRDTTEDEMDGPQPSTSRSRQKGVSSKYSVWEGIKGGAEVAACGGVPARNSSGGRIILFLGIIDILQSYRLLKKFEHTWKSILHDGDTISVHNPRFYASRFLAYMQETVFKRAALRHSPSQRGRSGGRRAVEDNDTTTARGDKDATTPAASARVDSGLDTSRAGPNESLTNVVSPRDVVPFIRGTTRRSYNRQDTQEMLLSQSNRPKEKRVERLFASSARADGAANSSGISAQLIAPHATVEETEQITHL